MEEKRTIKAEPGRDEPSAQGAAWRQPGTAVGGAGGGVTPTGKVGTAVPRQQSRAGWQTAPDRSELV